MRPGGLRRVVILGLVAGFLVWTAAKPGTRAWRHWRAGKRVDVAEEPARVHNRSPWFEVAEDDVELLLNYTGMKPDGEQLVHLEIGDRALAMIRDARRWMVASVFLFDSLYAEGEEPVRDVVGEFTELLVSKRRDNPAFRVAVILDPSHKAYGHRVSPSERRFREAGIDVFYSDLLDDLKRSGLFGVREALGHGHRLVRRIPVPGLERLEHVVFTPARIETPMEMDEQPVTPEMIFHALLLKANHRKVLVCDDGGEGMGALVSSANPHNPSVRSPNHALSVRGEPARYVYRVLRADIRHSIGLGGDYTHWHDEADEAYVAEYLDRILPPAPAPTRVSDPTDPVRVRFVSESKIVSAILDRLAAVEAGDEIRIQMFYLSYKPVLEALARASRVVDRPIRLLLDPNKDSFGRERDGTPNRQAAHWLTRKTRRKGKLNIRWYSTHGEQNHAKTMSITHPGDPSRNWLTVGSCNWTGRNMAGVNMEANLVVAGSERINGEFNTHFDRLWANSDGIEFSLPYQAFSDHAGYWKWRLGERPYYYSTF